MKNYYSILGVSPTATAVEIRAVYRRLVQQYHPDVNPNPQAHEFIKELNEAYEVLGDADKRRGYDFIINNPSVLVAEEPPKTHRDPYYQRRGAYQPRERKVSAQAEFMLKSMPYVSKIAWAGCITCFILFVDFLFPRYIFTETIQSFRSYMIGRTTVNYIITDSGNQYKIGGYDWQKVEKGAQVQFIHSGLLHVLIEIRVPSINQHITNLGTLYRNFLFVPLLLLALSVPGVILKKQVEFRFNLGVVTVFVLIFTWSLLLF